MNPLPSIEVLSFFDWMDKNGYFNGIQDETIEERLLDNNGNDILKRIIKYYYHTTRQSKVLM